MNEFKPYGVSKFSAHVIRGRPVSKNGDEIEYAWCVGEDEVIMEGMSEHIAGKVMASNKRLGVGRADF